MARRNGEGSCTASCSARRLGSAEEVPEYQRRPFIHKFYRLETPRLRHFWCPHNELGNIWTHIVALVLTTWRAASWFSQTSGFQDLEWPRNFYLGGILLFFASSLWVFCASVQFHWRICSPEREALCWRCLDQSACLGVVCVGYAVGIPIGFHCNPTLRLGYMVLAAAVCLTMAVLLVVIPKRASGHIRNVVLVGSFVALIPALHWLYIPSAGRDVAGQSVWMAIAFACAATVIFVRFYPERWAPGRFDLICSSHQFWHVLAFLVVIKYSDALVTLFEHTGRAEFCGT